MTNRLREHWLLEETNRPKVSGFQFLSFLCSNDCPMFANGGFISTDLLKHRKDALTAFFLKKLGSFTSLKVHQRRKFFQNVLARIVFWIVKFLCS